MSKATPPSSSSTGRCAIPESWAKSLTPAVPDLWINRKFVPIVVAGLSVWAFYVGVGRVCVPAMRQDDRAGFSRGAGIGILVVFIILWLMFMWSYAADMREMRVPSARTSSDAQHVPKSDGPPLAPVNPYTYPILDTEEWGASPLRPPPNALLENPMTPTPAPMLEPAERSERTLVTDPLIPHLNETPARVQRPVPPVTMFPRWCQYCEIIKPPRTHHCRHCGTCVLQFDHHCVWIGRCVGWANHAIFLAFNLWAGLFCLFNSVILIIDMAIPGTIDPQKIVLIVISGFLALFTLFGLLPTHIVLVLTGKTTLESFQTGNQERAEAAALKLAFAHPCPVRDIRRVRKEWKEEYGGVNVNDRWAFGRKRDMWRQEMGEHWIGWILPVGRPRGDGIHFAANPRFGPNGEWLKMKDWPKVVAVNKV